VLVVVQGVAICGTPWDWWFEDDSMHRVFVRDHTNLFAYFMPDLVSALSLGHSVTPWFTLTFRIDALIHSTSALPAYLHSLFSVWLTACALFMLLRRFMHTSIAGATACLWIFLPSTVVSMEFLSSRHYIEGLFFSLLSVYFAHQAIALDGEKRHIWTAALFYLLCCTTKEVYVSATWFVLLSFYLGTRHYRAALGMVACGVAYAAYRLVSLGLVGKGVSASFLSRYYLFPIRLPYIFAGSYGGYLLFALLLGLLFLALRRRLLSRSQLIFLTGLFAVLCLTIFPVTAPVTDQFQRLGTWYRVVFLLNTVILAVSAWLVSRMRLPRFGPFLGIVTAVVLFFGAWTTASKWDEVKQTYVREGQFYLKYPERLLYCKGRAPWFIYGLHEFYLPDSPRHYLTWRVDKGTPKEYVLEQIDRYDEVWVYEDGAFKSDPTLEQRIRYNCENERNPLHKPIPEEEETE